MSSVPKEMRLQGVPVSGGIALARICLFNDNRHAALTPRMITTHEVTREKRRFEHAVEAASMVLAEAIEQVEKRIGTAEAAIFVAQRMMLSDPALQSQVFDLIENELQNAEAAVAQSFEAYESALALVDNAYMRERATDMTEAKQRLLDALGEVTPSFLCAREPHCQRGYNRIVVAGELTPTLTMDADPEHTLGFVTERGGAASHAAILVRALGVPAVTGIENLRKMVHCGMELLVNGDSGEVIVHPSEATLAALPGALHEIASRVEPTDPIPGFVVMANAGRLGDCDVARATRAEGIGLYRTEFAAIAADKLLDGEEQFDLYVSVIKAMDGRPVTFRLLDIGGDKSAPFFDLPEEDNPCLGLRGSRLLLSRPELLETQMYALARASEFGPVNILYPMVIDLDQFLVLREVFDRVTRDIPTDNVRHGVMFEVPGACLQARELLEVADFGSIGSNDLTQYLFAVDRNNQWVADDFNPDRPAFWSLVRSMVEAAEVAGKPLSICGEMAANPKHLAKLIELGITSVSVSPRLIPEVRRSALKAGIAVA